MSEEASHGLLSTRGVQAAAPSGNQQLFDVWSNLYDADTNPDGYVSLGVAENTLMHKEMAQYINDTFDLSEGALTYGEGGRGSKRLRAAMSHFVNRYFQPVSPVKAEQINVSNGVTTSIEGCAFALGNKGNGFLLGQPYYGSFPYDVGDRAGIKLVRVTFGDVDPFSLDAVAKYEEALLQSESLGTKVKALILCNPHNPLGRCYSRETLIAIMRVCQRHAIHLISDEIYALSVWHNPEYPDAATFTSVLSIDTTNTISPELVHVLWGLSKDFGANGLRIGCLISQHNPQIISALKTHALYTFPSSPSDHIACKILENDKWTDWYIKENQKRLSENYALTVKSLDEHDIPYYPGSNAAFFVWVDLGEAARRRKRSKTVTAIADLSIGDGDSKKGSDTTTDIMAKLLEQRVFLASGKAFGSERPGWFRIVFSQPREYLEKGLARMLKAIERCL
jgi:aspartate/methionine/tyrosine aminotransferase